MGVGIPGTGMVGLPIAIALGALIGRSDYGLEVLRDCTPEAVEQGKAYIATDCIDIQLKKMLPKTVCRNPGYGRKRTPGSCGDCTRTYTLHPG